VQELQAVRSQVEDHLSGPGNLKGPAAVGDSAAQQDAATSEAVGRLFAEGSLESDVRVGRAFRVCVCENLCRPYGTRIYLPLYPALRLPLRAAKLSRAYGAGFSASKFHWQIPGSVLTHAL